MKKNIFLIISLCSCAVSAASYYVNAATGNNSNDGLSKEKPFAGIGHAAGLVKPGDVVNVAPGVYFEQPQLMRYGTKGKPIIFRAEDCAPDQTVVTAADPDFRNGKRSWKLENPDLQLYSIDFTRNPARILYSGYDLFPYSSLDGLKTFTLKNNYPGIESGFFFDASAKRLYVRLRADGKYGSSDPGKHQLAVAPPNAGGYNGHHLHKPEHSIFYLPKNGDCNIILDGFTLETPGAAGVLTYADGLVVRNVTFKGCRFGVGGVARKEHNPSGIFVENCLYYSRNIFTEMRETIDKHPDRTDFYWWQRKGVNSDSAFMKNYETSIAFGNGTDWHIRNNQFFDVFEGMSCWGLNSSHGAQIYGNDFRRIVDNAIETENHNKNMRIYFNYFEDIFEPLSHQPLGGLPFPGPVFIYRNIVNRTPGAEKIWPHKIHHPGVFKIGAQKQNWEKKHMGGTSPDRQDSRISKRFFFVDYPGFLAFNNTIESPGSNILSTPQPVIGENAREHVNFRFFNNIFICDGFHRYSAWRGSLIEFFSNAEVYSKAAVEHRKIAAGQDGVTLEKLQLNEFILPADSKLRNYSRTTMGEIDAASDLGAIPYGFKWQLAAGPGNGPKEFSKFQQQVRYEPTFIRTMGPVPGLWGVYLPEGEKQIELTGPFDKLSMTLRFPNEPEKVKLLDIPNRLQLTVEGAKLLFTLDGGKNCETTLPVLSPALWQTLVLTTRNGKLTVELNGTPLMLTGNTESASLSASKVTVNISRIPIFDIQL